MIKVSTAKTTFSKAGKFQNWRIFLNITQCLYNIFSAISTYSHLGFLCRKTMICQWNGQVLVKKQLTSATSFKLMCSKSARKRNIAIQSFSEIVMVNLIGNRTLCHPIQAVIILVINKSDSHFTAARFCYHSYDYSPNWTPLSPINLC